MTTFEEASAAQNEAQSRAEQELGFRIGSGVTRHPDGWAVKLYVTETVEGHPAITQPIRGVPVVLDLIEPPRLQVKHNSATTADRRRQQGRR